MITLEMRAEIGAWLDAHLDATAGRRHYGERKWNRDELVDLIAHAVVAWPALRENILRLPIIDLPPAWSTNQHADGTLVERIAADPDHLKALALSGALPEAQAVEILANIRLAEIKATEIAAARLGAFAAAPSPPINPPSLRLSIRTRVCDLLKARHGSTLAKDAIDWLDALNTVLDEDRAVLLEWMDEQEKKKEKEKDGEKNP